MPETKSPATKSPAGPALRAAPAPPDPARARAQIFPLYGERSLRTGETFTAHADGMAEIVGAVRADPDLLAASYLFGAHDVLRDADDWIRTHFGAAVAQLVSDLRQLMLLSDSVRARMRPAGDAPGREQARDHGRNDAGGAQDAALRRMLLAMVNDLRVVVLRLASRQQTLRYFAAAPREGIETYARETAALYAPLANRLGIWQIKWELEDLSLRFLQPEKYQR
ncbi:MAG TPA: HD domain-containing protein, partial [Burkholderiaceae bacterium]